MRNLTSNYNGDNANTLTYHDKSQKKRCFNDFEVRSYADEALIAGIKEHYPDDIEKSIIRFDLVKKYLITAVLALALSFALVA